jgi:hypothetical protein
MSPNPGGTPANLQPSHPGNQSAVRHGAFSRTNRILAPRAAEIADAIMSAGHVDGLDRLGAEEVGALMALIEALDNELERRGPVTRDGSPRKIVDLRLRASGRLERWLAAYGLTPAARADLLATLASGGLAAEIARRRAENGGDAA